MTETPLVRLGDVAAFLKRDDEFEHDGTEYSVVENEATNKLVHLRRLWNGGDQGGFCGLHSWQVRLISPRLVPVPVGETIPAGVPWANLRKNDWSGFEPLSIDWKVQDRDSVCYRLSRDPAPRLATRADVREGMRVRVFNKGDATALREGLVWLCDECAAGERHMATEPAKAELTDCDRCGETWLPTGDEELCPSCADKEAAEVAHAYGIDRCGVCERPWGEPGPYQVRSFEVPGNPLHANVCGDCLGAMRATVAVRQPDPEPNPHGANRANFLHHLRDDVDVWGV